VKYIGEQGEELGLSRYPIFSWQINRELELWNPLAHPSMMYRRDILVRAGGYNEALAFAQDFDLARRLRKYGAIRNLVTPGVAYRRHLGQISQLRVKERNEIVSEIISRKRDGGLNPKAARAVVSLYESSPRGLGSIKALGIFLRHRPITALLIVGSLLCTRVWLLIPRLTEHLRRV
jgi:hypothetical protein